MGPADERSSIVVKVGGSLFDLPDLRPRLRRWLAGLGADRVLLVPGGGPTADVIRQLDPTHGLGEEAAHWLALRAVGLNAHLLAALLGGADVVSDPEACLQVWAAGRLAVLDAHAFARGDEGRPGCLPHSWGVTSDSVAARVAEVVGAGQLALLKSVAMPEGADWHEAARLGIVDAYFPKVAKALRVRFINLRAVAS